MVLTEGCHGRIGTAPPAVGKVPVLEMLQSFYSVAERFHSPFAQAWEFREAAILETEVVYSERGGHLKSVPCAIILRTLDGFICDLRILLDPTGIPSWPFVHGG